MILGSSSDSVETMAFPGSSALPFVLAVFASTARTRRRVPRRRNAARRRAPERGGRRFVAATESLAECSTAPPRRRADRLLQQEYELIDRFAGGELAEAKPPNQLSTSPALVDVPRHDRNRCWWAPRRDAASPRRFTAANRSISSYSAAGRRSGARRGAVEHSARLSVAATNRRTTRFCARDVRRFADADSPSCTRRRCETASTTEVRRTAGRHRLDTVAGGAEIIELPLERQRRVVVGATTSGHNGRDRVGISPWSMSISIPRSRSSTASVRGTPASGG